MQPGEIEAVFRDEAGRALAALIRLVGDFELAEEGLQDAFAAALVQWPTLGVPAQPRAWLVRVGRNKAVDRLRRRIRQREALPSLEVEARLAAQGADEQDEAQFGDDLLRLIFTCCHPSLALETQVALTLKAVCGLTTAAVARSFLVGEEAMAQRLVRAKTKIREARIPYRTPEPHQLDERIDGVLACVYLVFTEGYAAPQAAALRQAAIRLARQLDELLPGRGAIKGLLALLLLHDARSETRLAETGDLVLLEDQDRRRWNRSQIAEGAALVEQALTLPGRPSAYAVQAAIAALHALAPTAEATDWPQIAGLYQVLMRLHPTPVVELNQAAAVAMVDGPARGLDLLDALAARGALAGYHLLPGARADLLRRLGRKPEAVEAYGQALELAPAGGAEGRLYARRLRELG